MVWYEVESLAANLRYADFSPVTFRSYRRESNTDSNSWGHQLLLDITYLNY